MLVKTGRVLATLALFAAFAACGGNIDRTSNESTDAGTALDGGAPDAPGASLDGGAPNDAAIAVATAAIAGHSFRVKVIEIGGYSPTMGPSNYREVVDGDLVKVCFAADSSLIACQCTNPLFASVNDIQSGGNPVDSCNGPIVCGPGTYSFDDQGRLRVLGFPDDNSLLANISPDNRFFGSHEDTAGTVTVTTNGVYVDDLCGLGQALLEPITGCSP